MAESAQKTQENIAVLQKQGESELTRLAGRVGMRISGDEVTNVVRTAIDNASKSVRAYGGSVGQSQVNAALSDWLNGKRKDMETSFLSAHGKELETDARRMLGPAAAGNDAKIQEAVNRTAQMFVAYPETYKTYDRDQLQAPLQTALEMQGLKRTAPAAPAEAPQAQAGKKIAPTKKDEKVMAEGQTEFQRHLAELGNPKDFTPKGKPASYVETQPAYAENKPAKKTQEYKPEKEAVAVAAPVKKTETKKVDIEAQRAKEAKAAEADKNKRQAVLDKQNKAAAELAVRNAAKADERKKLETDKANKALEIAAARERLAQRAEAARELKQQNEAEKRAKAEQAQAASKAQAAAKVHEQAERAAAAKETAKQKADEARTAAQARQAQEAPAKAVKQQPQTTAQKPASEKPKTAPSVSAEQANENVRKATSAVSAVQNAQDTIAQYGYRALTYDEFLNGHKKMNVDDKDYTGIKGALEAARNISTPKVNSAREDVEKRLPRFAEIEKGLADKEKELAGYKSKGKEEDAKKVETEIDSLRGERLTLCNELKVPTLKLVRELQAAAEDYGRGIRDAAARKSAGLLPPGVSVKGSGTVASPYQISLPGGEVMQTAKIMLGRKNDEVVFNIQTPRTAFEDDNKKTQYLAALSDTMKQLMYTRYGLANASDSDKHEVDDIVSKYVGRLSAIV